VQLQVHKCTRQYTHSASDDAFDVLVSRSVFKQFLQKQNAGMRNK